MTEGLSAFVDMGGYAAYVWPSYAVAAIVLGGLVADSVRRLRVRRAELARLEARYGPRRSEVR